MEHSLIGEGHSFLLLINLVVTAIVEGLGITVKACQGVGFVVIAGLWVLLTLDEVGGDLLCPCDLGRVIFTLPTDDKGSAGFVDED